MHVEINLDKLSDEVIRLHEIARTIEKLLGGPGQLSKDIRNCADRVSDVIKKQ